MKWPSMLQKNSYRPGVRVRRSSRTAPGLTGLERTDRRGGKGLLVDGHAVGPKRGALRPEPDDDELVVVGPVIPDAKDDVARRDVTRPRDVEVAFGNLYDRAPRSVHRPAAGHSQDTGDAEDGEHHRQNARSKIARHLKVIGESAFLL